MKNYYNNKVFWAFFFSSFLITMAGSGVNTFFPILLSHLGFEYSIIGLTISAARAIGAILQIFIGSLIDRQKSSKKKQILAM
ncbi:MAG: MFS transporter, partial [candidate division WOR-3 bacterium]